MKIHQLDSIKDVGLIIKERNSEGLGHTITAEGLISAQRQARKLISGTTQTAKTGMLSYNRTQSKVVTGLLIEHNTLSRLLYLMGLTNISPCRRCGVEEGTSAHVLSE